MSEQELSDRVSGLGIAGTGLGFEGSPDWYHVVETVRSGLLPRLEFADERPIDASDFEAHFGRSLRSLRTAEAVCEAAEVATSRSEILKHFVVPVILLCSENNQVFISI
jgi:hypothetical protein